MIMRVWRGWTTETNADAFELFLCEENSQANRARLYWWNESNRFVIALRIQIRNFPFVLAVLGY